MTSSTETRLREALGLARADGVRWRHAATCKDYVGRMRNLDLGPCDCGLARFLRAIDSVLEAREEES